MTGSHLLPYFFGLVGALAAVFALVHERAALQTYWQRACTGRSWRRTFPEAGPHEIRQFLYMFVGAFAFSKKRALQFAPTDRVLSIYRSIYPSKGTPDALELETFAKLLHEQYRLDLQAIWRENLTLGEIFARAARH